MRRVEARMLYSNQYSNAFARIGGDAIIPVVSEYLENYEFGFMAGVLLIEAHHRHANTAMWDPMRRWPDFSEVEAARERRRSTRAPPSSPMADRLFGVIERLGRPENEDRAQLLAILLGKLAISIPHGDRRETVGKLLSLPQPIAAKQHLLAALVMDGEVISADVVMQGVRAWIDQKNKQKYWVIDQHLWEVEGWIELLPFSDRPETTVDAIAEVNAAIGRQHEMERVVTALSRAPGEVAERLLGQLARQNRGLAGAYHWESQSSPAAPRPPLCCLLILRLTVSWGTVVAAWTYGRCRQDWCLLPTHFPRSNPNWSAVTRPEKAVTAVR